MTKEGELTYVEFMYLQWLMNKVRCKEYDADKYFKLFKELFNRYFTWTISLDANRAYDGKILRDGFKKDVIDGKLPYISFDDLSYEIFFDTQCTTLEMLIGLSYRCEYEVMGEPGNEKPYKWFWEFLNNLKLLKYDYDHFDEKKINNIIDVWLNRDFDNDGKYSIFPLKRPYRDQTKIQIWEQMNQYLNEKYPIL